MRKLRAIEAALKVSMAPSTSKQLRSEPLPDDVFDLIQIAAGCEDTCRMAAIATGRRPDVIRDAAVHYLHLVLFTPGASSRRVLGANDDAPREVMLRNKRGLLKWLHPDRNANVWEVRYLDRVLKAWENVTSVSASEPTDQIIPMGDFSSLGPLTPRPSPSDAAGRQRDRTRVMLEWVEWAAPPRRYPRSAKIFAAAAMFVTIVAAGLILATMPEPFENLWGDKLASIADAPPPVAHAGEAVPRRPADANAARDASMTIRRLWPPPNHD